MLCFKSQTNCIYIHWNREKGGIFLYDASVGTERSAAFRVKHIEGPYYTMHRTEQGRENEPPVFDMYFLNDTCLHLAARFYPSTSRHKFLFAANEPFELVKWK
jgi:hypothetical protein